MALKAVRHGDAGTLVFDVARERVRGIVNELLSNPELTPYVQMIHITPYQDAPTLGPCERAKVAIQLPAAGRGISRRLREISEIFEDQLDGALV